MLKKIFSVMILAAILIFSTNFADAASRDERDFIGAACEAKVVNCNEWISLRYSPSVDSDRIATIPLGTVVTVYDSEIDGFYPVEYRGMKGYCLKEYLKYYSGGGAPRH